MDKSFSRPCFQTFCYICHISTNTPYLKTDLTVISLQATEKEAENDRFKAFVQQFQGTAIDAAVFRLNEETAPKISCTQCGNCCKTLMVNITDEEADRLSAHLKESRESFDEKHLEKGSGGLMIINSMPCHFLENNACTVYEYRFAGCKEFPALHLPGFKERLFTTFMHYGRCPIIFNVVEQLKVEMGFKELL